MIFYTLVIFATILFPSDAGFLGFGRRRNPPPIEIKKPSIALYGATGATGQEIARQLLFTENASPFGKIKFVVRDMTKFSDDILQAIEENPNASIVKIPDLTTEIVEDVVSKHKHIVNDVDIVLSAMGHVRGSSAGYLSANLNIIQAALGEKSHEKLKTSGFKPKKMIVLAGAGVQFPLSDSNTWGRAFTCWVTRNIILGKNAYKDMTDVVSDTTAGMYTCEKSRDGVPNGRCVVEGVVVRPFELRNREKIGRYRHRDTLDNVVGITSRPNVADFMIKLASNDDLFEEYRGKAPMCIDGAQSNDQDSSESS